MRMPRRWARRAPSPKPIFRLRRYAQQLRDTVPGVPDPLAHEETLAMGPEGRRGVWRKSPGGSRFVEVLEGESVPQAIRRHWMARQQQTTPSAAPHLEQAVKTALKIAGPTAPRQTLRQAVRELLQSQPMSPPAVSPPTAPQPARRIPRTVPPLAAPPPRRKRKREPRERYLHGHSPAP
jgi:hypothetical protein